MNMYVGMELYGRCNGYFGDSYPDKRIEAFGLDWIIAREYDGSVVVALFDSVDEMERMVSEWSVKPDEFEELFR